MSAEGAKPTRSYSWSEDAPGDLSEVLSKANINNYMEDDSMIPQHTFDTWKSETYGDDNVGVPGILLMATGALPAEAEQAEVPDLAPVLLDGNVAGPSEPRKWPREPGEIPPPRGVPMEEADRPMRGYVLMTEEQLQKFTANFMEKWEEA